MKNGNSVLLRKRSAVVAADNGWHACVWNGERERMLSGQTWEIFLPDAKWRLPRRTRKTPDLGSSMVAFGHFIQSSSMTKMRIIVRCSKSRPSPLFSSCSLQSRRQCQPQLTHARNVVTRSEAGCVIWFTEGLFKNSAAKLMGSALAGLLNVDKMSVCMSRLISHAMLGRQCVHDSALLRSNFSGDEKGSLSRNAVGRWW